MWDHLCNPDNTQTSYLKPVLFEHTIQICVESMVKDI